MAEFRIKQALNSIIVKLITVIIVSQIIAPIIANYILKFITMTGFVNTAYAVLVSTLVNLIVLSLFKSIIYYILFFNI